MGAILVVRHQVEDYAAWRVVYDELEPLRLEHGCTDKSVAHATGDAEDLFITHVFPSVEQAGAFAHDPVLGDGMARAGVTGAPRIEIFESV
jgi:hypothetical protein